MIWLFFESLFWLLVDQTKHLLKARKFFYAVALLVMAITSLLVSIYWM